MSCVESIIEDKHKKLLKRMRYSIRNILDRKDELVLLANCMERNERVEKRFAKFMMEVSFMESRIGHSIIVYRMPEPFKIRSDSFTYYHSIEEYLVRLYNDDVPFMLYLTPRDEFIIEADTFRSAIIGLRPEGELMYRTLSHEVIKWNDPKERFRHILVNIMDNSNLTENVNAHTKFEKKKLHHRGRALRVRKSLDIRRYGIKSANDPPKLKYKI